MNEQDAVVEGRRVLRRRSVQEREQLVEEFKASGAKSQAAFCEERSIKLTTFKSWFYKKNPREAHLTEVTVAMPEAVPVEVIFPSWSAGE
ncbi:MAG: hypothetical protein A2283_12990 [Lentisphaerae bacterium RIFOXYA12_FULL_48_11]|nr:MAG: hypothetical protein A2283_12990 [Lentisphaerae bacterium RIFOXYA12_FULL_48_11]